MAGMLFETFHGVFRQCMGTYCNVFVYSFLHSRLRTATLRSDFEGQAVLMNCLLRNYLEYNLFEQASKLVSKSAFPEGASNNEWARYLFYLGRIRAIQLDYSEARRHLLQAVRKAPQHAALGFKQTVSVMPLLHLCFGTRLCVQHTLPWYKSIFLCRPVCCMVLERESQLLVCYTDCFFLRHLLYKHLLCYALAEKFLISCGYG